MRLKNYAEDMLWLECLEDAGVDSWEGIDYAKELYQQRMNEIADSGDDE